MFKKSGIYWKSQFLGFLELSTFLNWTVFANFIGISAKRITACFLMIFLLHQETVQKVMFILWFQVDKNLWFFKKPQFFESGQIHMTKVRDGAFFLQNKTLNSGLRKMDFNKWLAHLEFQQIFSKFAFYYLVFSMIPDLALFSRF